MPGVRRRRGGLDSAVRLFPLVCLGLMVPWVFPVVCGGGTGAAFAAWGDVEWGPDEVVAAGAIELPAAAGTSVVHSRGGGGWSGPEGWYVTYVRDGEVFLSIRSGGVWRPETQVSTDPTPSHEPRLAFSGSTLHLLWEDARSGQTEIWTRRWNGSVWSDEECLTEGGPASSAPALGFVLGSQAKWAVWQEATTPASVQGRQWNGSAWEAPEVISDSPAAATEPTVCDGAVAWTDARHGLTEIYFRRKMGPTWEASRRLTDLAGACRRPVIHRETCCGDYARNYYLIVFEQVTAGIPEIWSYCLVPEGLFPVYGPPRQVTPSDGVPSQWPSLAAYTTFSENVPMGTWSTGVQWLLTYTDGTAPGARTHGFFRAASCAQPVSSEPPLTDEGLSVSLIGAVTSEPRSGILPIWLESRNGQTTLVAREGWADSCSRLLPTTPGNIVVGPEGEPAISIRAWNLCGGGIPYVGLPVYLSFSGTSLTWDAEQPHPTVLEVTDDSGWAHFHVRAGGCSPTAMVGAYINGIEVRMWTGVRSPDVNGDCAVRDDDVAYVESRLGTGDSCADLDGSGTVDAADLALVTSLLGDLCSQVAGVPEGSDEAGTPRLVVAPIPFREAIVLKLLPVAEGVRAAALIYDAGGRRIRNLGLPLARRGERIWSWDGRDDSGRSVAAGVYFARIQSAGTEYRRILPLVR